MSCLSASRSRPGSWYPVIPNSTEKDDQVQNPFVQRLNDMIDMVSGYTSVE